MIRILASSATACLSILLLPLTLCAQSADQASASSGVSKVRIVRLSQIKGDVLLDRHNGRGFEPAMANLPIVEQSRLQTEDGVAEVEFEDNSTLRLAPDSSVEFSRLERMASGATASAVHVLRGTAYVSLMKTRGNQFTLAFGQQTLELQPASHVRLQMDEAQAKLAVLDGTLHMEGPSGAIDVPRKKTVTFSLRDGTQPKVDKDIASNSFDSWDKDATGYHARVAASAFGGAPYAYGTNDMMYYGSFVNSGGCGSMWRPYFASAAWDPYSNGAWAWYSGAGYSWVSPYPWGWTPYHFGNWSYCSGTGWGWQPGGAWNGLNNAASISTGAPHRLPISPVRPPHIGEPTTIAVNSRPLVRSEIASPEAFVLRRDSAGFGIPRNGLGGLNKLSHQATAHGTTTAPVYFSAPSSMNPSRGQAAMNTISMHQGHAPASMGGGHSSSGGPSASAGGGGVRSSSAAVSSTGGHAAASSGHGH